MTQKNHDSDFAVRNLPAYLAEPCDCEDIEFEDIVRRLLDYAEKRQSRSKEKVRAQTEVLLLAVS